MVHCEQKTVRLVTCGTNRKVLLLSELSNMRIFDVKLKGVDIFVLTFIIQY